MDSTDSISLSGWIGWRIEGTTMLGGNQLGRPGEEPAAYP